jgi:hypothetical protein
VKWLAILAVTLVVTACCYVRPPSAEGEVPRPEEVAKPARSKPAPIVEVASDAEPPCGKLTVGPCGYYADGLPRF